MSRRDSFRALLAAAALGAFATLATAQSPAPFGVAPPEALNTLNEMGSPSPQNPFAAGGGAPAGGQNNPFGGGGVPEGTDPGTTGGSPFGGPAPSGPTSPFGGGAPAAGGGAPAGGGNPFGAPAAGGGAPFGGGGGPAPAGAPGGFETFGANQPNNNQPVIPPVPQRTRVLTGTRRYCSVTGRLIEDARWQEVWNTVAQRNYYDDGTHGDAIAGDQIYTRIDEYQNEMSPTAFRMFLMNRNLVRSALERDPLIFFQLTAMTSDPDSALPKFIEKERDQDARIAEWNNTFLRTFRVNPDDVAGEIFPVYVPEPPTPPDMPAPPGFVPPTGGDAATGPGGQPGQRNGDAFDDFLATGGGLNPGAPQGVTGTAANPAASSNYFSTTAR